VDHGYRALPSSPAVSSADDAPGATVQLMFVAGLLASRRIAVSGVAGPVATRLGALGAELRELPGPAPEDPPGDEADLVTWCGAQRPLHGLVVSPGLAADPTADPAAGDFTADPTAGDPTADPAAGDPTADPTAGDPTADPAAITDPLADTWRAIRGVAVGALIPDHPGGRIILIGPPRADAPATPPVTAGLENLARTLSVEWARFGITTVCLDPGPDTSPAEIAELVGFVLSRAGGYLSGCCLRLGSVPVASRPLGAT
jgi:hypothetical protein